MTERQKDDIDNALLIGMALEDAYVYAGVSPKEIALLAEDDEWMARVNRRRKHHEYSLLHKLEEVQDKQIRMGKEGAVTWALEHMYPRYANKQQGDGKMVTINFASKDPITEDTVEIYNDVDSTTASE